MEEFVAESLAGTNNAFLPNELVASWKKYEENESGRRLVLDERAKSALTNPNGNKKSLIVIRFLQQMPLE